MAPIDIKPLGPALMRWSLHRSLRQSLSVPLVESAYRSLRRSLCRPWEGHWSR